jgi:hypothetical protein
MTRKILGKLLEEATEDQRTVLEEDFLGCVEDRREIARKTYQAVLGRDIDRRKILYSQELG